MSELGAWFSKLLEPVKFSQQELASAGEMGQRFGNMLATALKLPGEALNQLRGGIDWVLGKLGIIDEKSDKVKDKLPPPKMREQDDEDEDNADARPAASRASLNSTLSQPLPSVNNSNVDNRQHTVTNNIYATGDPRRSDRPLHSIPRHRRGPRLIAAITPCLAGLIHHDDDIRHDAVCTANPSLRQSEA
ncbi:hypothetical protein [Pantoea sp. SGAir0180]